MASERKILADFKTRLDKSSISLQVRKRCYVLLCRSFNAHNRKSKGISLNTSPAATNIIEIMVQISGLSEKDFIGSKKHADMPARQLCWYLLHQLGYNYCAIGRYFNRNRSTVSAIVKTIQNNLEVGDPLITDLLEKYNQHAETLLPEPDRA
jgi:chromosomal replication initiation ATPase DnaA